jgi:hypothetical protein
VTTLDVFGGVCGRIFIEGEGWSSLVRVKIEEVVALDADEVVRRRRAASGNA